jgi:shikimate dehydrogenase
MTDRYAVIGHPVAHSKSPWIHAEFARQTRQDLDYARIEAPLDGFERAVEEFRAAGGCGANITLPFKERAFAYCGGMASARARTAAAVNTLRFEGASVYGDNTDGVGLVIDLERNLGRVIAGKRVLLIGAGGAARGVLQPVLERGPAVLKIANRTARRAEELADLFQDVTGGGFGDLAGEFYDLLINATSAGLANEAPQLPKGIFAPGAFAYDMVYGRDTPFLALARAAGAVTSDGLGMLVEQAAESFLLWRGVRPDTAPVLAALRGR